MAEYSDSVDPKEGLVVYSGFKGLRNNVGPEMFAPSDLVTALNIDIYDSLDFRRRKGHSAPLTAAVDRSLWASGGVCLGVGSDALKRVHANWSTTTLRSGLTALRPLSYAAVADRVYWSNGAEAGCVDGGANRSWGLAPPAAPFVEPTGGSLRAGKYQIVVTWLRQDGQESGASRATTVELTAAGGVSLSSIPVSSDPTVTKKIIYMTPTDGETLYKVGAIDNAATTFALAEPKGLSSPLITQFLREPPAGDFIDYWKGWMLVANGNRLYASEPYAPELFDWRKSIPFLDRITMVASLNGRADGVWVGTESQIMWLSGDSPETWRASPAADYGVLPGTLSLFDGDLLGDGSEGGSIVAFFFTTHGACVARSDGSFTNVTQNRFSFPVQPRGAGIVRRHNGMIQYVATLEGTETAGNVFA